MNYADTWAEDEYEKKFIFTVEMKRRLANAGLPIEPASLKELGLKSEYQTKSEPKKPERVAKPKREINEPEMIQIDPGTGKFIGTLKWYNSSRGYGFISRGGGEDIFFHKTSTVGDPLELEEGQWVLYDVEERAKGPEATEVEPYNEKPAEPTELAEPTEPTELAEPTEPTEPAEPTEPTELAESTEPSAPVEPSESDAPAESSAPSEPPEPAEEI